MSDPRGLVTVTAGGKDYRLWLGASVLADLQSKHGQDVIEQLQKPEGASKNWMPNLQIVVDLFMGSLQRYHAQEADRYLVDEILLEDEGAFGKLMEGSGPAEPEKPTGNRKARRAAA